MITTNDVARVYDTILSTPGMNELVKIDLKISRKNVLLLNQVIRRGLSSKEEKEELHFLGSMAEENLQDLKALAGDCLLKAGLVELNEKLGTLTREGK